MLETGTILNDRYEIIRVIGKGGMSTVYLARCLTDGKLLAVKDVSRSATGENRVVEESLSAEGRMLKQLSNPHLPKIYEIIENQTNIMLIMDYVNGQSLDKVIAATGAQPMDKVLDWGMQICSVFAYLHGQPTPIIYRDMKPANVMVDAGGNVMMIDFGTARTEKVGVAMQEDTVCIGTVGFAAPEQYGGFGQSTAQTDIFCLGATLYNMITGHSPCDRPVGILPLERWIPALAQSPLAKIIYKCTKNDPAERYQSANDLYYDLSLARSGVPSNNKQYLFNSNGTAQTWQKQEVKRTGYSGGLSGLLKRKATDKPNEPHPAKTGWQTPNPTPAQATAQAAVTAAAQIPVQQVQQTPLQQVQQTNWQGQTGYAQHHASYAPHVQNHATSNDQGKKLTVIGAILAALMVVLGMVMLLCEQTTAAFVFLIFAAGAAVLALAGMVLSKSNPVS